MFRAAPPGTGGLGHVNEQPPEHWLSCFESQGACDSAQHDPAETTILAISVSPRDWSKLPPESPSTSTCDSRSGCWRPICIALLRFALLTGSSFTAAPSHTSADARPTRGSLTGKSTLVAALVRAVADSARSTCDGQAGRPRRCNFLGRSRRGAPRDTPGAASYIFPRRIQGHGSTHGI